MSNKNGRAKRTATCEVCQADIPVGRRGPLPRQCKQCKNRSHTVQAAFRRRGRYEEREFLASQAFNLKCIIQDLEAVRSALERRGDGAHPQVAAALEKLAALLAETRDRKSVLDERKRVLDERWERAQKRRYAADRRWDLKARTGN